MLRYQKNGRRRRFLCALLALAITGIFTGCASTSSNTASGSASAYDTSPSYSQEIDEEAPVEEMEAISMDAPAAMSKNNPATAGGNDSGEITLGSSKADAGRKIIYTVDMTLETLEFDSALSQLEQSVESSGGFLESSSISGETYYGALKNANLTARIPSEKLDSFLNQVGEITTVTNQSRNRSDITRQYTDIEARKKTLQTEYDRLMELLAQAESLDAVIALEARLSEIRYQLDNYTTSLNTYDEQVSYSTVTMYLREVHKVSETEVKTIGQRMSTGLSDTAYNLKVAGENFLVFLVVNLPVFAILAIIILPIFFFVRRSLRKRKRNAPPQNPNPYGNNPYPTYPTPNQEANPQDSLSDTPENKK